MSNQHRIVSKSGRLNIRNRQQMSFSDLYHDFLRITWPQFLGLFTLMFLALNALFGFIYFSLPEGQFEGFRAEPGLMRYLENFFFSVQTFGTIGYGKIAPVGILANVVMTFESYTSFFVVAVLTGLIFARFARPHAKVMFSHHAVIREFDGIPCLLFRLANARQNYITDARVAVSFAFDDPKTRYRVFNELKLERTFSPIFALSWTVAHDIDDSSPLKMIPFHEWETQNAELVVTFSGTDTTLSQKVYAKSSYVMDEILINHDFADVIKRHENGEVELMLEKFDVVHALNAIEAK